MGGSTVGLRNPIMHYICLPMTLPINFNANLDITNFSGHQRSKKCGDSTERYSKSTHREYFAGDPSS
jgi:hypothetical protein